VTGEREKGKEGSRARWMDGWDERKLSEFIQREWQPREKHSTGRDNHLIDIKDEGICCCE